jgi:predicted nucleotide-binding protein (sugar kinase/HSP70/actin superfamily)
MNIPIKSDIPQSMKAYLQVLNPILKLKDKEIEVLSSFLSIWQSNRDNANIDKMLFSTPVRKMVRKQIGMSEASFNNHITMLRKKNMIVDKKINSNILSGIDKEGIEVIYRITWNK